MQPKHNIDGFGARERDVRSAPPVLVGMMDSTSSISQKIQIRSDADTTYPIAESKPADATPAQPETLPGIPGTEATNAAPAVMAAPQKRGPLRRFFAGCWHRKWLIAPAALAVIAGAVFALPQTRYPILALGLKRAYHVTVTDSKTLTPVSGARVTLDGQTATTDAKGQAALTVRVGPRALRISKQYYKTTAEDIFVGISTAHNAAAIKLAATGRQVPVKVVDKITGKALVGATIKALDTSATTDDSGQATIVLPTTAAAQPATISADGHNDLAAHIQVTDKLVDANTFAVTPAGRIYFLSNLSGKIDVVAANLDGTARKTVVAGTGSEDADNTILLASRDWKYLALLSKRDGGTDAKLYLINTATSQLTTIDSTAGSFTLIGWSEHYFLYKLNPDNVPNWQPGGTLIKSYNAEAAKAITLVTSSASGTSDANAQYENIWDTILMGDTLVYDKTWYVYPGYTTVTGQQDVLASVHADGSSAKTLKSVDAGQYYVSSLKLAAPHQAYFAVNGDGSNASNYFRLDQNGNVTQGSTITVQAVSQNYPTYLVSPSGAATFWTELRDGKNTLFVGNSGGANGTQIASLSDYSPYGWFTDNFLLVQKNSSELYILPAGGGTPLKISDYYKPSVNFYGYGGGYGGL